MIASKKTRNLQHLLRIILVLALIALAGYASQQFKTEFDWTYGGRNTLTEASQQLLSRMPEPITFTAFAGADAEVKRGILADLARYTREKDDIEIRFVDPAREPQKARAAGITAFNEVQVSYQGNSEILRELTEPVITRALQRIADPGSKRIAFLQGHGERRIDSGDPSAMSDLAAALRETGLQVGTLNLAETPDIADDIAVIVLASPQRRLLEGEQRRIADWVEAGGNLIWLSDPDSPADLGALNAATGIQWQPGVAVFPDYEQMSGHPGILLAANYPPNPVTARLRDITIFPLIRAVDWDNEAWDAMPLIVTNRSAWLETGPIEGDLRFEPEAGDIEGPLTVGVTLTRNVDTASTEAEGGTSTSQQQRIVAIGDADFLTNVYFGEVGNRTLALNLFQWAATRDRQLDIDIPAARDSSLHLSGLAFTVLAGMFVIGIPLLLVGFGVLRWAIRRRR